MKHLYIIAICAFFIQLLNGQSGSGSELNVKSSSPGFNVTHPGPQKAGEEFSIQITNARDVSGNLLSGDILVTVTCNEDALNEVFNGIVTFADGFAGVGVSLQTGTHNLAVVIDGIAGTVTVEKVIVAELATWKGTIDNNWQTAGNWDPAGIPGSNVFISIPSGAPVISSPVEILAIEIQSGILTVAETGSLAIIDGGRITIKPGTSMTVEGTLTNNAGVSGLIIESDDTGTGSVILNNEGVPATAQRYVRGDEWQIISAPVSGMEIGKFLGDLENDIFYNSVLNVHAMTHYDETVGSNGEWAGYYCDSMHGIPMVPGRSYLVRKRTSGPLTFRGQLVTRY